MKGYYLYQDKISGKFVDKSKLLVARFLQQSERHQDPYFGEVSVFTQPIDGTFIGDFFPC